MRRGHRQVHARLWSVLGIALPVVLLALVAMRQTVPVERPAVMLEPPSEVTGQEVTE